MKSYRSRLRLLGLAHRALRLEKGAFYFRTDGSVTTPTTRSYAAHRRPDEGDDVLDIFEKDDEEIIHPSLLGEESPRKE